jgi:hypothetical protein
MPTTNYLNPVSIAPELGWKPNGATAGMLSYEREQDYNTMMKNQMLLQDMATRSNAINLYNDMQDVPLKDAKRADEITRMDASRPFIADLARTGAQNTISKNQWETEVERGPEARASKIAGYLDSIPKMKQEQFGRELGMSVAIMERVQAMEQAQPGSGAAWAQKVIDDANKKGYNLDSMLANPEAVRVMYPHVVETNAEFQRKKREQEQKDKAAMERIKEQGKNSLAVAQTAAAASDRRVAATSGRDRPYKTSMEAAQAYIKRLQEVDSDPNIDKNSPEYQEFVDSVYSKAEAAFDDKSGPGPAIRKSIAEHPKMVRQPPEEIERVYKLARQTYAERLVGKPRRKPIAAPESGGGGQGPSRAGRWEKLPNGGERWVPGIS